MHCIIVVVTKTVFRIIIVTNVVTTHSNVGRFGKNRKDERVGDKLERKGSAKWRTEESQASEEETQRMKLEQER